MTFRWQYQSRAEPVLVPSAETITLDKWYRPASEPVRAAVGIATAVLATIGMVEPAGAFDEIIGYQWQQPTSQPVLVAPRPVDEGGSFFGSLDPIIPSFGWYEPASEPVRTARFLVGGLSVQNIDPISTSETITLDKWYQPASEPVRVVPRALDVGWFAWHTDTPDPPELSWFQPASEPVRLIPRALDVGWFAWNTTTPDPPVVPDLAWYQPASEPVWVTSPLVPTGQFTMNLDPIPTTRERQRSAMVEATLTLAAGDVVRLRTSRFSGSDTIYTVAYGSGLIIRGPLNE